MSATALRAVQLTARNHSCAPLQFDHDFYDLPLIAGAGFVNGTAEVSVYPDGVNDAPEVHIGRIFLHGENNTPVEVPYTDATEIERQIYLAIWGQLDSGPLASKILDHAVGLIREVA